MNKVRPIYIRKLLYKKSSAKSLIWLGQNYTCIIYNYTTSIFLIYARKSKHKTLGGCVFLTTHAWSLCNVRKKLEPIKHEYNAIMISTTDLSKNALDCILIGNNAHWYVKNMMLLLDFLWFSFLRLRCKLWNNLKDNYFMNMVIL